VTEPTVFERQMESAALRAVNIIRLSLGLRRLAHLRKGEPKSECRCPIARSLPNGGVTEQSVYFTAENGATLSVPTPIPIAQFVYAFDAGRLRHLELKR
jgi:hypothetical protein